MPALVPAGWWTAAPVRELPREPVTRDKAREWLGLRPDAELVRFAVRPDPDAGTDYTSFRHEGEVRPGWVFVEKVPHAFGRGMKPNIRASAVCGHLIYGDALRCWPDDEIVSG